MKYKTIYADPPWPEHGGGKCVRGANKHYPLMSVQAIRDMAPFIISISEENCHLYLWVTNNFLPEGLRVMEDWGFRYVTKIVWLKDRMGIGQYFRGISEDCLFGIKGSLPYKEKNGKRCQGKTAFAAPQGPHSMKPEKMREMIELVSHPPRIEIFARQRVPKWDVWGNQSETKTLFD
jgi:N6-adenosine-specific RNA methylase IME4